MMNAKKAPVKVSNVMKLMNFFLYSVFALQILVIVILSSISYNWKDQNRSKKYTSSSDAETITVNFGTWVVQLLTYWVAYSHMIPISLYVMIEIMKLLLARLINADEELRDKETKAYSDVRNSDLIEELGQVQFVFSDKTGTLTQNKMEFKKFSVGGLIYPDDADLSWTGKPESERTYADYMKNDDGHGEKVKEFFKFMSLCHKVVAEKNKETGEYKYQSPSPDEEALVKASAKNQIVLTQITKETYTINILGEEEVYKILYEFPFNSTRKRQSIVMQDPDGQHWILTKGADSIMAPRVEWEDQMENVVD